MHTRALAATLINFWGRSPALRKRAEPKGVVCAAREMNSQQRNEFCWLITTKIDQKLGVKWKRLLWIINKPATRDAFLKGKQSLVLSSMPWFLNEDWGCFFVCKVLPNTNTRSNQFLSRVFLAHLLFCIKRLQSLSSNLKNANQVFWGECRGSRYIIRRILFSRGPF